VDIDTIDHERTRSVGAVHVIHETIKLLELAMKLRWPRMKKQIGQRLLSGNERNLYELSWCPQWHEECV